MSRIQPTFLKLAAYNKKGLITFITAGDPTPELTVPLLHALVAGGADILELGVPFSDPMAEGPIIQRACERALKFGVNIEDVLGYVREFRRTNTNTPIILMGYANTFECYGINTFIIKAKEVGVDGSIIIDYPLEECKMFVQKMRENKLDPIFLLAPTSSEQRIKKIAKMSSGFNYYVSLTGVTGACHIDILEVKARIAIIRKYIKLPIGIGFGIYDSPTAKALSILADAIIIGSCIIQKLEHVPQDRILKTAQLFIKDIRQAIDSNS